MTKIYGSNANSFIIKALDNKEDKSKYFLKFLRNNKLDEEVAGTLELEEYLTTPKVVLTSNDTETSEWVMYEYTDGRLFSGLFLQDSKIDIDLIALEKKKELILNDMYSKTCTEITFADYSNSRANALFLKRIKGNRFNEYYTFQEDCISNHFDKKITINNYDAPKTINAIFETIRSKYEDPKIKNKTVSASLGHGDAHHGNIIYTRTGEITFIDNEYFGNAPPFMELSKPYYNDLLGELFFNYNDVLRTYFEIISTKNTSNHLHITVKPKQHLSPGILITGIKLKAREKFLKSDKDVDFLTLNDYLIMCHTLTRNPNFYDDDDTKFLFLAFTIIFAEFDPLNPESMYEFFNT